MPDKQDRYRKRKGEQGFQRVEVLVPREMTGHLKAYARALRDAHTLRLDPPLFDGMSREAGRQPDATFAINLRSVSEQGKPKPVKHRPDFSGGLLRE